jgi:hypothetical protein
MINKTKFGEFQVVHLDTARHKHRGIKQFAVRDAKQNYIAYCSTEQEAEAKARFFNEDKKP